MKSVWLSRAPSTWMPPLPSMTTPGSVRSAFLTPCDPLNGTFIASAPLSACSADGWLMLAGSPREVTSSDSRCSRTGKSVSTTSAPGASVTSWCSIA